MKKLFYLLTCCAFIQVPGQPAVRILKDIGKSVTTLPAYFNVYANKLYFRATDSANGEELWSTDGTESGTVLVKDIKRNGSSSASFMANFNGKMYFRAADTSSNYELFVSDGTANGTFQLKEINPSKNTGSNPGAFTVLGNLMIFSANDGSGLEPWVTDGTSTGTMMLKNINASGSSIPAGFTVYNNKIYFSANDGVNGRELWVTDGTTTGTQLLKNINTGTGISGYSSPDRFIVFNNLLIFSAEETNANTELWCSDGTPTGTKLLKEINSTGAGTPNQFVEYNGKLYFKANDGVTGTELWVTDGTTVGTKLFMDFDPTGSGTPGYMTVLNGKMYLSAMGSASAGGELWVTDGTVPGTKMVKDLRPAVNEGSGPNSFSAYKGKLYFIADDGSNGSELWYTDGTATGTAKLVPAGATTNNPMEFFNGFYIFNDTLYFAANFDYRGHEVWKITDKPIITNIKTINTTSGFHVYPNPSIDVLNVFSAESTYIQVMDYRGAVIYSRIVHGTCEINVSIWNNGIYFIVDDRGNCIRWIKG